VSGAARRRLGLPGWMDGDTHPLHSFVAGQDAPTTSAGARATVARCEYAAGPASVAGTVSKRFEPGAVCERFMNTPRTAHADGRSAG